MAKKKLEFTIGDSKALRKKVKNWPRDSKGRWMKESNES